MTHVTARQSDRLRWTEDGILTLIVNRLFASRTLRDLVAVDQDQLKVSAAYRKEVFYRVFPKSVHAGKNELTSRCVEMSPSPARV